MKVTPLHQFLFTALVLPTIGFGVMAIIHNTKPGHLVLAGAAVAVPAGIHFMGSGSDVLGGDD